MLKKKKMKFFNFFYVKQLQIANFNKKTSILSNHETVVTKCKFENLLTCSSSYENNTLRISHSVC